ncbi:unnamed protein product, partial [Ectocarpus fasciculatus]
ALSLLLPRRPVGVVGCLPEEGTRVDVDAAVPRGVVTAVLAGCGDGVEAGLILAFFAALAARRLVGVVGCLDPKKTRFPVDTTVFLGVVTVLAGCGEGVEAGLPRPVVTAPSVLRWLVGVGVGGCLTEEGTRVAVDAAVPGGVVTAFLAGCGDKVGDGLLRPIAAIPSSLLL